MSRKNRNASRRSYSRVHYKPDHLDPTPMDRLIEEANRPIRERANVSTSHTTMVNERIGYSCGGRHFDSFCSLFFKLLYIIVIHFMGTLCRIQQGSLVDMEIFSGRNVLRYQAQRSSDSCKK